MECHVYVCPKRKVAQTVTLTLAQSFNAAYQAWQLSQIDSTSIQSSSDRAAVTIDLSSIEASSIPMNAGSAAAPSNKNQEHKTKKKKLETWVSFENETEEIPLSPVSPNNEKSFPTKPMSDEGARSPSPLVVIHETWNS